MSIINAAEVGFRSLYKYGCFWEIASENSQKTNAEHWHLRPEDEWSLQQSYFADRAGHREGLPAGGARAYPLRTLHAGKTGRLPRRAGRLPAGSAGTRLRLLHGLRSAEGGFLWGSYGPLRWGSPLFTEAWRSPAAVCSDQRTGHLHGRCRPRLCQNSLRIQILKWNVKVFRETLRLKSIFPPTVTCLEDVDGVVDHSSLNYLLGFGLSVDLHETPEGQESIKAKLNAIRNKLVQQVRELKLDQHSPQFTGFHFFLFCKLKNKRALWRHKRHWFLSFARAFWQDLHLSLSSSVFFPFQTWQVQQMFFQCSLGAKTSTAINRRLNMLFTEDLWRFFWIMNCLWLLL